MVKKYNISKPEKYIKDGQEKTFWANIGTMTEFQKQDGSISRILEIPAISLKANIFPVEPRDTQKETYNHSVETNKTEKVTATNDSTEDIDPNDIPW